jgi:WD40 repeat protein
MLMTTRLRLICTVALVITAVTRCQAADEPLTRAQIVKTGKAATALVEVKAQRGEGHASAFCVHPDGWFITNAHVAVGDLTLVLNPNMKNEKSYRARVVRRDEEADLALLKVEGVTRLSALSLGSDEGLVELTEVIGFGYPLSSIAGREISVIVGKITALRHKEGHLEKIQLDGAFTKGNSGGPVLDNEGKVMGVVNSGIVATGLNFAIPVSVVSRFVAQPDVQFHPPPVRPSNLHTPTTFEARVTTLMPSSAPLTVELVLKAGKGPERTLRMDLRGDRYRVTAVPIPEPSGPWTLRLAARFDNATLEATTTERSLTIGGREVKLSDVRSVFPGSPSRVVLRSGETITGVLAGLEAVSTRLSGQTMSVDLASAKEVTITPVGEADKVQCLLVVRQGENETFRKSISLTAPDLVKLVEVGQLRGHTGAIDGLAVSSDGRHLLSGSTDHSMILWDCESAQPIRRFRHPTGEVMAVACSPDGRRALSGCEDRMIRLWDLQSGETIRELAGHKERVFSLAFSPDGRLAYSTSGGYNDGVWRDGTDSAIRVWDVETGREVSKLEGHKGIVWSVAVSPDGRRLLSAGEDSQVILWDAQTGAMVRGFRGHTAAVRCAAFLPGGQRAVSCSNDRTIRLWQVETSADIHVLRGHTHSVGWVAVSPDGRLLLSADYEGRELRLWDVETGKTIQQIDWGNVNPNRGCFTPDGLHAVWTGGDGVIRVYELKPDESGTGDNLNESPGPDISGRWFCYGRPCYITRTGPGTYDFRNEDGGVHPNGRLVSRTEINAWEMKGIIRQVGGRMTIAWSNGTEWVRTGASSP